MDMATSSETLPEWYTVVLGTCTYKLPARYQEVALIGQGAFGAVM